MPNIMNVILRGRYALIVEAIFDVKPGSLWEAQLHWAFPFQPTIAEVKDLLPLNTVIAIKSTKSAFKGDTELRSVFEVIGI